MTMRKGVFDPRVKAEGDVVIGGRRIPYTTDLVNSNGVCFQVWLDEEPDPELEAAIKRVARDHRDCVSFTWYEGAPAGYWTRRPAESQIPHAAE